MANLFLARDQTAHTNLFKVNVMSDKKCFKREFEQLKKDFRRRSWQNLFWQEVRLLIRILPRNRNLGKNFSKLILKLYLGVEEGEKRKTCNFSIKYLQS